MRCLLLFCFMLGLTLAFPTIKLQEPKKDQKIMDLTLESGYMEIYGNNYTKHSQVKARQEKSQPQPAEKVQMDNRRVSPTNDVTDVQAKTNETVFNKTKGIATEMLSFSLKSLKYFHKRSAELSHDQSKLNNSTVLSYPDDSSDPGDTNENSASLNDSNNTGSSEFSNGAESSESSNPTESNKSDSEEFTYSYDSQETTHAASDELNRSSFLNGITVQSESIEPDTQYSIFTTPYDASENSSEVRDSSIKGEAELSSESQSASSSSESNDQSDSSKSSSSSDSNSSSNSSEPMTVSTTEKMI